MTGHYDEGFPDSRELVKSDHLTPFLADDLSFFLPLSENLQEITQVLLMFMK